MKLVDFGIAKIVGEGASQAEDLTKSGVAGSPTYMSPEQCLGKARSNLYSIACIMYESLTGETPFSGESPLELMQRHSAEPPPTVSELRRKIDISEELAKLTLSGLAKDPAFRPQTAAEYASKLKEELEGANLKTVPQLKKVAIATSRKLAIKAFAFGLLCLVLLCCCIFMARKSDQNFEPSSLKQAKDLEKQASVFANAARWVNAEITYKKAKAILAVPSNRPERLELASIFLNLANCYRDQGQYAEAEPLYKPDLELTQKAYNYSAEEASFLCLPSLQSVTLKKNITHSQLVVIVRQNFFRQSLRFSKVELIIKQRLSFVSITRY